MRWAAGRVDPTRIAQGIITGIGFLGAGVIVRERLAVRGLTTAAIGILIGTGFYIAAGIAEVVALGTLALFRLIEAAMQTLHYARVMVRFRRASHMQEGELRATVTSHGITSINPSYAMDGAEPLFQYEMTIRTRDPGNFQRLAETLMKMAKVHGFTITPSEV